MFEDMLFDVTHHTLTRAITLKDVSAYHHETLRNLNIDARITREIDIAMSGLPGLEFVAELQAARFGHIMRVVVLKNRAISIGVIGDQGIHTNALVRRFLDLFKFLPSP